MKRLLLLLMQLILCGIPTLAYDIEVNGIYYNIYDTTLKVTYKIEKSIVWTGPSNDYSGSVVIPEFVTYNGKTYVVTDIGEEAFLHCTGLTSVTIPNSVTRIGGYAFRNSGLRSVTIPNSVTSIGGHAFYQCYQLTSVTIPNSVTSIGGDAFYQCSNLTSVNITDIASWCKIKFGNEGANPLQNVVYYLYVNGKRITDLNIPNSVTSIGNYAFYDFSGLASVTIPNSVTTIGQYAFDKCSNLKKVLFFDRNMPSSFSSKFPSTAIIYNNCYIHENITYSLDKTIYTAKLVDVADMQRNVTIPKFIKIGDDIPWQYNITSIAKYAIYGNQIQSLTIGENIQSIENGALINKPIKTIWLTNTPPNGYTQAEGTINYVANNQYTSFNKKIVYPYISSIFEVDGIKYVPVSPSERTCDAIDCLCDNTAENIHIGKEVSFNGISMKVNKIQDYFGISNTYIKTLTIDGDCSIPTQAFKGCENLETVKLSNTGNVGDYAFADCKKLRALTIDNAGSIGQYAFANLKNLQTISFGRGITTLGDSCFFGCEKIGVIDIPENITSIGSFCFRGCTQLSNVTIGNGVKSIGSHAFSNCAQLRKIKLGSSLTAIENYLFHNCSNLADIEVPNTISQIKDNAFSGCTGLKTITFKDSNTSLSLGTRNSLSNCPLDNVYIGRDLLFDTSYSFFSPFYRNTTLRSVTFSDKVTEISNYEFYGCSGLKVVIIGNGVTKIGDWAFSGCSNLENFSFGSKVKTIGKEAFSDCTAMTRLESHANTPPTCGSQALDDINKWNCQLYVPETSLSAYQSADQWKDFFFINTLTVDPLLKDMLELRMKSDSLITSYKANSGGTSTGSIIGNVDDIAEAQFTTPPTGLLTSASQLSSNAKATNEGSYEALLDGNQTTYFHTTWLSGKGDAPNEDHYLQIDLQEEVERIALKYGARGSISSLVNPKDITIYAKNNANGSWEQITTATLTYDNNSNGKGLLSIDLGGKYRYIRISVQSSTLSSSRTINGHSYWCLGELRIYNLGTSSQEGTTPQENEEKPKVPKEVVENLQNCINAANTEISTNAATQSTYDALLSAYNTFLGYLNESTDIERVQITPSVDVWFDLQGRRITKPQTSGIYIHNGKKVWVK